MLWLILNDLTKEGFDYISFIVDFLTVSFLSCSTSFFLDIPNGECIIEVNILSSKVFGG